MHEAEACHNHGNIGLIGELVIVELLFSFCTPGGIFLKEAGLTYSSKKRKETGHVNFILTLRFG